LLPLLLLIGLAGLLPVAAPANAQSEPADLAVRLLLLPAEDQHSNLVEPGELLRLLIQAENVGSGDAFNLTATVPYNRDRYLLVNNEDISGLSENDFRVVFDDILPPGQLRTREVLLRVNSDVRPGTRITMHADYTWDDTRAGREDTSSRASILVSYRDDEDDDDGTEIVVPRPDDETPPVSCMLGIMQRDPRSYTVVWGGSDASDIESYDVQIRKLPNGLWRDWRIETENNSAVFGPVEGETFGFRVRARDTLGNEEAWPINAQLTTNQADVMLQSCPGAPGVDAV
jgi:hypothetical protein